MAKIRQGILGGLSGKVGNVVGGTWKGISYLRSLPAQVSDANSIAQRSTRLKMSMVMQFLQTCTPLIRVGFGAYAVKMSAFNAATSYNYHEATEGDYPDYVLTYNKLLVSRGNLTGGENAGCVSSEAGKISISWVDNSGMGTAQPGDTALLLVYNPVKNQSVFVTSGNSRSDAGVVIELPVDFSGDEVHCYLGFADMAKLVSGQARDFVSNSVYAGSVVVA